MNALATGRRFRYKKPMPAGRIMNLNPALRQRPPRFVAWLSLLCVPLVAGAAGLAASSVSEPVFRGQVQYFSAGSRELPTVVLVHGIGDKAARDWDGLAAKLLPHYRVVTFDLPGFGRSSKGNEPYTPENYVTFLRFLVQEQVRARQIFLIGHSMGGAIALRYAARYPQDVRALVLVGVPGILHRSAYSQYLAHLEINTLPNLFPTQNHRLRNLVSNIMGWVEKAQPAPEVIVATPQLRQTLLNSDPAKIAGLALALEDFSQDIARVQAPTLVVWGGRDNLAPMRNARVLYANLAHAQLVVFDASGHTPMDDVPEGFGERVVEFLRSPVIVHGNGLLRDSMAAVTSTRTGSCRNQLNKLFEGEYERLHIENCRDVVIRNARVRSLHITDSTASIEDSRIGGADGGVTVDDARVMVTSSLIQGPVAMTLRAARLDIAGSRIVGQQAAIVARSQSDVLFSVSRIESPHFTGRVHALRVLRPDQPL